MNIYSVLESLCDRVDLLDAKSLEQIALKAKELNKELENTVQRLYQMKDIDYDKNKIECLFHMTEQSIEQFEQA